VALLPMILLSSLIGALIGGLLIALRKHQREIPIPFGPFIAAAGWVWFVTGPVLLQGYMQLTGLR
jgi:leader peptidase (prepilin peptidase)/N-methyltransferase